MTFGITEAKSHGFRQNGPRPLQLLPSKSRGGVSLHQLLVSTSGPEGEALSSQGRYGNVTVDRESAVSRAIQNVSHQTCSEMGQAASNPLFRWINPLLNPCA
jgi:hypothetical protein